MKDFKNEFPIFKKHPKLVYFDNAATTQKPEGVIRAMDDFYRTTNAPVHRGVYQLAEASTAAYEGVRDQVKTFINAKHREEIIFTVGTTVSVNTVVQGFAQSMAPKERVLLTDMEHHAMVVPWHAVSKWKQFAIDFVPLTAEGRLDMEAFEQLLKNKPKFVGVTYVSNVLGTVNPIEEIVRKAHEAGAVVLVDAAQAAAHIPIDVQKLDCDFLVFSGHKLYGPTGVGVLYGKKEALEKLPPFVLGGHMIETVTREATTYAPIPAKFEAGTPPVAEVIGLGAAISYVEHLGWEAIESHERELTEYALKALQTIPGLKILGPSDTKDRGPIFSFSLEGVHPHDAATLLDQSDIAVRGGHHCTQILHDRFDLPGSVRASLGIYNSKEEIDAFVEALKSVGKKLHG